MDSFLLTIIKRPYVFFFLVAFLFLAWRQWGGRRTLFWLISGYGLAWLSEFSSIHIGFPYGEYHYIYENLSGELLIGGVPFFDSLSYPFLIFAGYGLASFFASRFLAFVIFLGAFFTMLLDIIIDPVATLGDKWFLGQIHYYAHPGWYFGVPLSNFGGWFLVSAIVIGLNQLAWRLFPAFLNQPSALRHPPPVLNFLFYLGIALFNITVAFSIGEILLGVVSTAILGLITVAWLKFHKSAL